VRNVSCVVPTDHRYIESQFRVLVELVRRWGKPNLGLIQQAFEAELGTPASVHMPREQLRDRLVTAYRFYESAREGDRTDFMEALRREIDLTQKAIAGARRAFAPPDRSGEGLDDDALAVIDAVAEDAAGRLVTPATLAHRFMERLREDRFLPTVELLDHESVIFLQGALRVGNLLEIDRHNQIPSKNTRDFRLPGRSQGRTDEVDFSPAAFGVWKTLEREANMSVIQAARFARGVPMPLRFGLYDPELVPQIRGVVETGRDNNGLPIHAFINQKDWEQEHTDRHRFVELGKALHVCKKLTGDPQERFSEVIRTAIGSDFPIRIIDAWREVLEIRNPGSHTELVGFAGYEKVLSCVLGSDMLRVLTQIKANLLGGPHEVRASTFSYAPPQPEQIVSQARSPVTQPGKSSFSPGPVLPKSPCKPGTKVQAMLVEDPRGKKRPWATIIGGLSGRIIEEGTPQSTELGTMVTLVIHAVHRDHVDFLWPDAPRLHGKGSG